MSPRKRYRTLWRWLGTLAGVGLVALLLGSRGMREAWAQMGRMSPGWLALALGLYVLGQGCNALRWRALLRGQGFRLPFSRIFAWVLVGHTASMFLPSSIGGDGVRFLAAATWVPAKTRLALTLVLDRVINALAMVALLPVSLAVFAGPLGLGMVGLASWGEGVQRWRQRARTLWEGLRSVPARVVGEAWLWAWPSNLLPMAGTWVMARSLGMAVSYVDVVAAQTLSYWVTLLPISVYGWGVREAAYTVLFTTLGATVEQAVALALWRRVLDVALALPGALLWSRWVTPWRERAP